MRTKFYAIFFFIFLLNILSGVIYAEQLPVYNWKLPNGMIIRYIENSTIPLVNVVLIVKTGSSKEHAGINGITHMLEHLTFNGTEKWSQEELYEFFDLNGLYVNAQTARDYIAYTALGEKSRIGEMVEVLTQMVFYSNFPAEKFEKEKGIIISEIQRMGNRPDYKLEMEKEQWLYQNSNRSLPVLGTPESIRQITREQVIDYYHRYFTPDNMVVIIYGNSSPNQLQGLINRYWVPLPSSGNPFIPTERSLSPDREMLEQQENQFFKYARKYPAPLPEDKLFPLMLLMNETIFNRQALWMQFIPDSVASEILSIKPTLYFHPDEVYLVLEATTKVKFDQNLLNSIYDELLIQLANLMTKENILKWIKEYENNEILLLDKPMYFAFMKSPLLSVLTLEETDKILPFLKSNADRFRKWYTDYIETIFAAKSLRSGRAFKLFTPDSEQRQEIRKKKAGKKDFAIIRQKNYPLYIIRQVPSAPLTAMHVLFKNRFELEGACHGIAEMYHWLTGKKTSKYTEAQIDSVLSEYGMEFKWHDNFFIPFDDYYHSPEWGYIRSLAGKDSWRQQIQFAAHAIQEIDPDSATLEYVRSILLQNVQRLERNPSQRLQTEFFRRFFQGLSPAQFPPYGDSNCIREICKSDMVKFIDSYSSNSNLIISIVTQEDIPDVVRELNKYFIRKNELQLPVKSDSVVINPPFRDSLQFSGKLGNTPFMLAIPVELKGWKGNENLYEVLAEVLESRLRYIIREQKGWAYSLSGRTEEWNGEWFWIFQGAVRKGTLDSTLYFLRAEIKRLGEEFIPEKEWIRAKEAVISSLVRRFSSFENLAYLDGYSIYKNPEKKPEELMNMLNGRIVEIRNSAYDNTLSTFYRSYNLKKMYLLYVSQGE